MRTYLALLRLPCLGFNDCRLKANTAFGKNIANLYLLFGK